MRRKKRGTGLGFYFTMAIFGEVCLSILVGVGLILGGGVSNLTERLKTGKVYDYVQFPKAPGRLKQYVYNLADFAIFLGGMLLVLRRKKR